MEYVKHHKCKENNLFGVAVKFSGGHWRLVVALRGEASPPIYLCPYCGEKLEVPESQDAEIEARRRARGEQVNELRQIYHQLKTGLGTGLLARIKGAIDSIDEEMRMSDTEPPDEVVEVSRKALGDWRRRSIEISHIFDAQCPRGEGYFCDLASDAFSAAQELELAIRMEYGARWDDLEIETSRPEPVTEDEPLSSMLQGWMKLLFDVEHNIASGFLPMAELGVHNLICSIRIAEKNMKQRELVSDSMMIELSRALLEDWDLRLRELAATLDTSSEPVHTMLHIASHMRALLNC